MKITKITQMLGATLYGQSYGIKFDKLWFLATFWVFLFSKASGHPARLGEFSPFYRFFVGGDFQITAENLIYVHIFNRKFYIL
jgi:hypothetical protein